MNFTTGAAASQTVTDTSPTPHAATWGTNTKVETFATSDNRLKLVGTTAGSNTYTVRFADSADWLFDGNFTIRLEGERVNDLAASHTLISQLTLSTGNRAWAILVTAAGELLFQAWNTSGGTADFTLISATGLIAANTDYNFDVLRSSSIVKLYINGVEVASGTFAGAFRDATSVVAIGGNGSNQTLQKGWVKKVKILKGQAVVPTS